MVQQQYEAHKKVRIPWYQILFLLPSDNVSYMTWLVINRISSSTPVLFLLSL